MARFLQHALAAGAVAGILACAGCAGLPGSPIPEISIREPYNGEWVPAPGDRAQLEVKFRSPDGSGIDPVYVDRVISHFAIRPERFALEVSDSIFRGSGDAPGLSFSLPMDGTPIEVRGENGRVREKIALAWKGGTPVVRRTLPGIGWVAYRFELTPDGALVFTHTAAVRNASGMEVEAKPPLQFVYIRGADARSLLPGRGRSR